METAETLKQEAWRKTRRGRGALLTIALIFAAPVIIAAGLRLSGWEPARTRNSGELIQPPVALADVALYRSDGKIYPWSDPDRIWRLLVRPPADCNDDCALLLNTLGHVWEAQGRHADHLHVLWLGELPAHTVPFRTLERLTPRDDRLERLLGAAGAGSLDVYLIDPAGFAALHYPAGFDAGGLRKDLARLLK